MGKRETMCSRQARFFHRTKRDNPRSRALVFFFFPIIIRHHKKMEETRISICVRFTLYTTGVSVCGSPASISYLGKVAGMRRM